MTKNLKLTDVYTNNLKHINLELPHNSVNLIIGKSGSGKSSLAYDTIHSVSQSKYIQTFSSYTRQFFSNIQKGNFEKIENIRPSIAIKQKTKIRNSRSTVGSLSHLNDYLKIFFANFADAYCPVCGKKLEYFSGEKLAKFLINKYKDNKNDNNKENYFLIIAPIKIKNKKDKNSFIAELKKQGFLKFFDTSLNKIVENDEEVKLDKENYIYLAVDRFLTFAESKEKRLIESIKESYKLSLGFTKIFEFKNNKLESKYSYSQNPTCECIDFKIPSPTPALFSSNHPLGACDECNGFGNILSIDYKKAVKEELSIKEGAVSIFETPTTTDLKELLFKYCKKEKIPTDIPFKELKEKDKDKIYFEENRSFCGIKPFFDYLKKRTYKMHVRVFLSRYQEESECPKCHGTRLKEQSLFYKINNFTYPDLQELEVIKLKNFILDFLNKNFKDAKKSLTLEQKEIVNQIISRIDILLNLGLSYLTLKRQAKTLSGGETQRVNLVTALGSPLSNTHFILDEPSSGLHAKDTKNLIKVIYDLKKKNNTVTVLEHDPLIIASSEHLTELGEGGGINGGKIVFNGDTTKWNFHEFEDAINKDIRKKIKPKEFLTIKKANARNLKNIDVKIGINVLNVLCGVSGSGKSTLASNVIFDSYENYKNSKTLKNFEVNAKQISGFEKFSDVLIVSQAPIMKSPRSNIASFTKIWDEIRTLLASTEGAKEIGVTKSEFSFNVDGGRCPECKGMGYLKEDMQFLEDVFIPCPTCLQKRFKEKILKVEYKGKNVDDILNMPLDEAVNFFSDSLKIVSIIDTLKTLGLSYLTLGHPLSELSGGEAQRLKLAPYLTVANNKSNKEEKGILFIFDEPTTGLYPTDINNLILLFDSLIKKGHTILLIEHNEQVLKNADYILELGEGGGENGGSVVYNGIKKENNEVFDFRKLNQNFKKNKELYKNEIIIKNATEHNLKNISLNIPLNKMISLVGVSGSGKSTLAKNIIFSEGQRNFIDCLSPYARFFIKGLKKPEVDLIDNIPPVIFLGQQIAKPSSTSTLGTVSESYSFLRLLFAKAGDQYCKKHPKEKIGSFSIDDFVKEIKKFDEERIKILAPIINQKKGNHNSILEKAINLELTSVRVDGMVGAPSKFLNELERYKVHSIDYVIGEFIPKNVPIDIIRELVEQALSLGDNKLIILNSKHEEKVFNKNMACPICGYSSLKLDPEDFSFSSKRGACKTCKGTGVTKKGEVCPKCNGTRLQKERLQVLINGKNIAELSSLNSKELLEIFNNFSFDETKKDIAKIVLDELLEKLKLLNNIGLGDIPLNRDAGSMSRGEYQRLRLSASLGAKLTNALYIFDEPSIGLCKEDNKKVLEIFDNLKALQNTLLVIEHDKDTILKADHIIEIGPMGGKNGGKVIANEPLKDFLKTSKSITHQYLVENENKKLKKDYEVSLKLPKIKVQTGVLHNVKNEKCEFLFNAINTVVGVSGAGKSTLVNDIIFETFKNGKFSESKNEYEYLDNKIMLEKKIDRVLLVDQSPIAKNVRSTPASFLGIYDEIRKLLASTNDAKIRGFNASYFSYNAGKGKCSYCKGSGVQKLEMSFMPDATVDCPVCEGKRFNLDTLSIRYLGYNAYDFLNLTFDEVKDILRNHKKIYEMCYFANKIGIGYLKLGQVSGTLSGGEAQRLKLVKELALSRKGHTLFILDEPSIGLHPYDVEKLNECFNTLVAKDNTILLIEHDEDIIKNSDYIIKMGPGSGENGGKVVKMCLN